MSIVTISLGNRDFKLFCPAENHSQLHHLAEKLDLELNKIKQSNPSASFELTLVMFALSLLEDKKKSTNLDEKELVKEAKEDFQAILSSVFAELKQVAKILE
jgi:cell division protein ZapA (FtsZ GTPase activity inhibitor)